MRKYYHSKTRNNGEEVIQAASDLVDSEQVIKVAEKAGRKSKGDDLESDIKEDRREKGDDLETVG